MLRRWRMTDIRKSWNTRCASLKKDAWYEKDRSISALYMINLLIIGEKMIYELRHLLDFRFKRNSHYNLPAERLNVIEKVLQTRAEMLLE